MLSIQENNSAVTYWPRGDVTCDGNRYSCPTMLVKPSAPNAIIYARLDQDDFLQRILQRLAKKQIWDCLQTPPDLEDNEDHDWTNAHKIYSEAGTRLVAAPEDGACALTCDYNRLVYRRRNAEAQVKLWRRCWTENGHS